VDQRRIEPAARADRYQFLGQGEEGGGEGQVCEYEEERKSICECYCRTWGKIGLTDRAAANAFTKFETMEWSLETEDGKVIQLLDTTAGALDPFQRR